MSCFALTGRRRQRNPKKGVIPVPEPMRISGVERVGRQAEIMSRFGKYADDGAGR
jgi:hypothetical protein